MIDNGAMIAWAGMHSASDAWVLELKMFVASCTKSHVVPSSTNWHQPLVRSLPGRDNNASQRDHDYILLCTQRFRTDEVLCTWRDWKSPLTIPDNDANYRCSTMSCGLTVRYLISCYFWKSWDTTSRELVMGNRMDMIILDWFNIMSNVQK